MEFVEGGSLAVLLRALRESEERIPTRITARIVADALGGLHAAHELKDAEGVPLNLVHRDVSLQNVLVGVNGVSKITDFGIAKTAEHFDITESGILKGKVRYMSPEQAFGRRLDRRADVWAMGVILWELLTNQRLFGDANEAATLLRIISGPPPRVSTQCPVAPEVDDLVVRALAIDPQDRFPSAREFRNAVVSAWQREGGLAEVDEVGAFVRERLSAFEGGKHLILESDTTLLARRAN
jgi:serine/threonine-protein kinase